MRRIPLLAFFLICGTAQAAEGSWLVVDCGGGVYFPLGTDCRAVSPKQLGDRAEQQAREQRAWNAQQQEQQHAYEIQRAEVQQHIRQVRLEVAGAILLIVIVVIVLLLIVITRKRLAIGSFIARGIYAVSGFDVQKISERWDGYRRRGQDDSNQQAAESTVVSVSAAAPIPEEQTRTKKGIEPAGIGGWLILPGVGLAISPILQGIRFFRDIMPALEPNVWRILSDPTSENYHPMWAPTILFEAASTILLFIFTLWLGYLFFFRKSPQVPLLFIFWLAINLIIQTIDLILMNSIPLAAGQSDQQVVGGLVRSIGSAAIWIPYFIKSVRVKNTFTRAVAS